MCLDIFHNNLIQFKFNHFINQSKIMNIDDLIDKKVKDQKKNEVDEEETGIVIDYEDGDFEEFERECNLFKFST